MGACECVSENACRWVDVYISTVYSFTSSTLTSTPAVGPPKSYTRKKKHAEQYPACSEEPRTKLPKVAGMLLLSQRVIEKNSFTSSTLTSTPAVGPPKSYTRKKRHAEQYPACSEEPRTKLPKVAGMLLLSQRVIEKNVTQLPVWCCEEHTSWLWPHIPRCHLSLGFCLVRWLCSQLMCLCEV